MFAIGIIMGTGLFIKSKDSKDMYDEPTEWVSRQIRLQNIEQNMYMMIHKID